jgi:hypothetical protein
MRRLIIAGAIAAAGAGGAVAGYVAGDEIPTVEAPAPSEAGALRTEHRNIRRVPGRGICRDETLVNAHGLELSSVTRCKPE